MKKRIFHIISELDIGGTEKQLLLLLPELEKTLSNEVVCLTGYGEIGHALEVKNIPVHYLDGKSWHDPRLPFKLFRLLRKNRPAAVITYLIVADILGRFIARLAGVKIVICSYRSSLFGPAWWHQLDRFTRFLVTHYTCQTHATKKLLQKTLKLAEKKITVIPNAVADSFLISPQNNSSENNSSPEKIIITCVANLKPEKRIDVLLEVFEQLAQKYPSIHLQLVGEGPERQRLQQQRAEYKSKDRIHFLGLREDIQDLLAHSDMFVLPTAMEGMSNALLEAMASGLPCITTDISVNAELITDDKNGLLFDLKNPQSLHNQLEHLIVNPPLRHSLGQSAKNYIQTHHSLPHITQQWVSLINK